MRVHDYDADQLGLTGEQKDRMEREQALADAEWSEEGRTVAPGAGVIVSLLVALAVAGVFVFMVMMG